MSNLNREMSQEEIQDLKQKQLEVILENNPMLDDYHTGIRTIDDILTFEEAIENEESFTWGDFAKEDAELCLDSGEIKIYSSYDIIPGVFVSTSFTQAFEYAGRDFDKVKEKIVPLTHVAWINGDEGQYTGDVSSTTLK